MWSNGGREDIDLESLWDESEKSRLEDRQAQSAMGSHSSYLNFSNLNGFISFLSSVFVALKNSFLSLLEQIQPSFPYITLLMNKSGDNYCTAPQPWRLLGSPESTESHVQIMTQLFPMGPRHWHMLGFFQMCSICRLDWRIFIPSQAGCMRRGAKVGEPASGSNSPLQGVSKSVVA